MKYWKVGIFFLVGFLIQTSLLNLISVKGYTPNLILCLVVVFSYLYEQEMYGVVFGSVFGVFYDIMYSDTIGPTPIALVLVAIGILIVREYTNKENILNMWAVSIVSLFAYYGLNWGLHHLSGNPVGFRIVFNAVPWIAIYSLIIITALYLILIKKIIKHRRDRKFR